MFYLKLYPDLLSIIYNIQKSIHNRPKNVNFLPSTSMNPVEKNDQLAKSNKSRKLLDYFTEKGCKYSFRALSLSFVYFLKFL